MNLELLGPHLVDPYYPPGEFILLGLSETQIAVLGSYSLLQNAVIRRDALQELTPRLTFMILEAGVFQQLPKIKIETEAEKKEKEVTKEKEKGRENVKNGKIEGPEGKVPEGPKEKETNTKIDKPIIKVESKYDAPTTLQKIEEEEEEVFINLNGTQDLDSISVESTVEIEPEAKLTSKVANPEASHLNIIDDDDLETPELVKSLAEGNKLVVPIGPVKIQLGPAQDDPVLKATLEKWNQQNFIDF